MRQPRDMKRDVPRRCSISTKTRDTVLPIIGANLVIMDSFAMSAVDPYDLLAKISVDTIQATATELLRGKQWLLFTGAAFLLICGCVHGYFAKSTTVLPRHGALMCALSIVHAYRQLLWDRITDSIDVVVLEIFTQVELQKARGDDSKRDVAVIIAHKRMKRILPKLYQVVQRTFVA